MNVNEELKNNIINNLNNLKEKKLNSANKNKPNPPKQTKQQSTVSQNSQNSQNNQNNQNNPNKQHKKSKSKISKPPKENTGFYGRNTKNNKDDKNNKDNKDNNNERKNKFDRFDRNVLDNYSRSGNAKKEAAVQEEPEIEENKIDYADFLKNQNEIDEIEEKHEIVGVRFKPVGKIYFFVPENHDFKAGDKAIVETARGLEMGTVVFANRYVSEKKVILPLKPVLRPASDEDVRQVERNRKAAVEAMKIAAERIKAHGLKMKLIDAEYTFDNSKLIYYFTHDGRVDFRELVKDLASIFKVRIELRQVGIRDQTKVVGGLSICGRAFCCNSFLQDFETVTIKMAKDQNININSTKISGACGRLMCCLKYEHDTYEQLNKDMPRTGTLVETSEGESGVVIECNALTGICRVKILRLPNQRGEITDNIIKSYSKKQLKITGYSKKEQEISDENLADLDVVVEDGPVKSGIDIEV